MRVILDHVSKEFKGVPVLDDICLELESGNIYGIRGSNGSGKTMLMRAISGLIYASSGNVIIGNVILGKDISFPPSVGLLLENPDFIATYTGYKNLQLLAQIKGKASPEDIREALVRVGLNPDDKRIYGKYSLGMKQRLGIACAIMEKPDLILLDEPVNALDDRGILLVREILREEKKRGALIILACHDKEELELLADEILYIAEGRIIDMEEFERARERELALRQKERNAKAQ